MTGSTGKGLQEVRIAEFLNSQTKLEQKFVDTLDLVPLDGALDLSIHKPATYGLLNERGKEPLVGLEAQREQLSDGRKLAATRPESADLEILGDASEGDPGVGVRVGVPWEKRVKEVGKLVDKLRLTEAQGPLKFRVQPHHR